MAGPRGSWFWRNARGWGCVLIGIVLALPLVPGPGFLFILAGLAIADWPGKIPFFRWLRNFTWFSKAEDYIERKWKIRLPVDTGHHHRPAD